MSSGFKLNDKSVSPTEIFTWVSIPEELNKRFNAEVVAGIAAFYFAEKYPNNQKLGREIRKMINLLKKDK